MNAPRRGADEAGSGADATTAAEVVRSEEELRIRTEDVAVGTVRARTHVDVDHVERVVPREVEYADVAREPAEPATDSGQVETLPDGSLSIPVFEEQLIIEKRLVVRERVIIRKRRVTEAQRVEADLRRERVEIEADEGIEDRFEGG